MVAAAVVCMQHQHQQTHQQTQTQQQQQKQQHGASCCRRRPRPRHSTGWRRSSARSACAPRSSRQCRRCSRHWASRRRDLSARRSWCCEGIWRRTRPATFGACVYVWCIARSWCWLVVVVVVVVVVFVVVFLVWVAVVVVLAVVALCRGLRRGRERCCCCRRRRCTLGPAPLGHACSLSAVLTTPNPRESRIQTNPNKTESKYSSPK